LKSQLPLNFSIPETRLIGKCSNPDWRIKISKFLYAEGSILSVWGIKAGIRSEASFGLWMLNSFLNPQRTGSRIGIRFGWMKTNKENLSFL